MVSASGRPRVSEKVFHFLSLRKAPKVSVTEQLPGCLAHLGCTSLVRPRQTLVQISGLLSTGDLLHAHVWEAEVFVHTGKHWKSQNVKRAGLSLQREEHRTCYPPRRLGMVVANGLVTSALSAWPRP